MTTLPNPWLSESPMTMEDIKARPAVQPNATAGATDFPRGFDPERFFEALQVHSTGETNG